MGYFGGGYAPYVSVAERQKKAEKAIAKARKGGSDLTPISASRGAIAKTFWGKAWCKNLESYSDYANRMPRGRTYVRNGSVIDLKITTGEVRAKVMGSSLYTVNVAVTAVVENQWKAIAADCSGSVDTLVELLQGKLSKTVMERISKQGTGLFPAPKEIKLSCSCPDYATMCKHVAAVLYGVGARLDQQPELLFTLRKVDANDLVTQAGTGLQYSGKGSKSGKVLDDSMLADVFGIEMAEVATPKKLPIQGGIIKTVRKSGAKASTTTTNKSSQTPKIFESKVVVKKKAPVKADVLPKKAAVRKTTEASPAVVTKNKVGKV